MVDRVQVMKQEWADLGGSSADELPFPAPITPQEDAIESAGVFLQDAANRDETTFIGRNDEDMVFKDGENPSLVTLTELLAAAGTAKSFNVSFNDVLSFLVTHNRDVKPLVQVVEPGPDGWNAGGWGNEGWNESVGKYLRIPDDTYSLRHINNDSFIVTFASKKTGLVIYF
jgi:hypothetical protein